MILLNDFQRQWEDTREASLAAFTAFGESGWYILGDEVKAFEEALARRWGMEHCVGVASGLDAIEICLRTLGCKPGDKVLTTPLSAFPTTLAAMKLGAVPVFVDTDEFGLIDLAACRAAIAAHPEIRFFVPVHLYGHALDMECLCRLAAETGITTVEDCAQSIGADYKGIATGLAGRMAATSFYPTKNLGAMGDGGAILTNNADYATEARMLRNYGQSAKYRHDVIGYNSRLDEIHACLLRRVLLERLPVWNERRRCVAAAYLKGIENPAIRPMGTPAGSNSCWHLFPVLVAPERKTDFMAWLKSRQVACAEHYPIPIPDQQALRGLPVEVFGGLEAARRICGSEVSLPIHPYLQDKEVAQVIGVCNAWRG